MCRITAIVVILFFCLADLFAQNDRLRNLDIKEITDGKTRTTVGLGSPGSYILIIYTSISDLEIDVKSAYDKNPIQDLKYETENKRFIIALNPKPLDDDRKYTLVLRHPNYHTNDTYQMTVDSFINKQLVLEVDGGLTKEQLQSIWNESVDKAANIRLQQMLADTLESLNLKKFARDRPAMAKSVKDKPKTNKPVKNKSVKNKSLTNRPAVKKDAFIKGYEDVRLIVGLASGSTPGSLFGVYSQIKFGNPYGFGFEFGYSPVNSWTVGAIGYYKWLYLSTQFGSTLPIYGNTVTTVTTLSDGQVIKDVKSSYGKYGFNLLVGYEKMFKRMHLTCGIGMTVPTKSTEGYRVLFAWNIGIGFDLIGMVGRLSEK